MSISTNICPAQGFNSQIFQPQLDQCFVKSHNFTCPEAKLVPSSLPCIKVAGRLQLNPLDIEGSYEGFAQHHSSFLSEYIEKVNEEGLASKELTFCPSRKFSPKPLELKGSIHLHEQLFNAGPNFFTGLNELRADGVNLFTERIKDSAFLDLIKRAESVIESWYEDKHSVQILYTQVIRGRAKQGKAVETFDAHIDDIQGALVTVPASELPITRGSIWITNENEEVKILPRTNNEPYVLGKNLKTRTVRRYSGPELVHPKCYSKFTSAIVPGLMAKQYNEGYVQGSKAFFDPKENRTELFHASVTLPYEKSLLIPANMITHAVPNQKFEPNQPYLKENGCTLENTTRIFLRFRYSIGEQN